MTDHETELSTNPLPTTRQSPLALWEQKLLDGSDACNRNPAEGPVK